MNKKKIRIIGISILIFSLCLPIVMSLLFDFYDINKEVSLKDNQTEDILKKHPTIEGIYKINKYSSDEKEEYVVKRIDEYDKDKQDKLRQYQSLFSQEIQGMLNHKVMSHELLENNDNPYKVNYGTIITDENDYMLNQILRMGEDSYKSLSFLMETKTKKIYDFSVDQEKNFTINDEEMKKMAWSMIEYLKLDDIDDWVYNLYGYESNKAKLRVSCEFEKKVDINCIHIGVTMLGTLSPFKYQKMIGE